MLNHPTLEKLKTLRLHGMVKALEDQAQIADMESLSFDERLGLLVDREMTDRESRLFRTRISKAKLRLSAALEDIDFRHPRGLDKSLIIKLGDCRWVKEHHNLIVTGPTGTGKTYLACALAHKAIREGYTALYLRFPGYSRNFTSPEAMVVMESFWLPWLKSTYFSLTIGDLPNSTPSNVMI